MKEKNIRKSYAKTETKILHNAKVAEIVWFAIRMHTAFIHADRYKYLWT